MDTCRIVCHSCQEVQRDRWTYRNHLLRAHGEVIRGGTSTPVRLEGRELENMRAADSTRLLGASHRREALGLPRVLDQEAARRLHDNQARRACRSRAVARARDYVQQRAARQRRLPRTPADVALLPRAATLLLPSPPSFPLSHLQRLSGIPSRPAVNRPHVPPHRQPALTLRAGGASTAHAGSRKISARPSGSTRPYVSLAPPLPMTSPGTPSAMA